MATREEQEKLAVINLKDALNEVRAGIGIASLRHTIDGYQVVFHKGKIQHVERDIDPATLDDGPKTDKIRRLVQKVKAGFGGSP